MTSRDFEILYKETRLNLEPTSPSSIVQIRVASQSSFGRSTSSARIPSSATADNEKGYRTRNLATASSIYYRKHHTSPRGFHWRVLENDTVLSIRAADVCKQQNTADAPLILNLRFPAAIRTSCIGFSDPEDHDVLCVHVVDHANQLHTITLRPDHFRRRSATDSGLGDACKSYSPPGFGFKHPHRLVVVSSEQLIITMHDGGILRFDRNRAHEATNGTMWKETIYNVAGWGQSLRGLVPFQRNATIRYDKINMELTAATATAITSMGHDTSFLFTVCLDHRMRIWDAQTGQILYTGDILNTKRDPQEVGKWVVDPSQCNLIRILDNGPGQCLVATYSPIGAGEFKFWKVKANNQGSVHVADCFPEARLTPSSPSSLDVWTLADFSMALQGETPELWVLWKNNTTYRVQKLTVHSRSATPFADGWKGVFVENGMPAAQSSGPCDAVDSTEKWLDLIFFPGRFSKSTLETALAMYEKGLGTYKETTSSKAGKSIAESICSVLGSTTTLDRSGAGGMDYEQFRGANETQWMRFWRLLLELDKQRGEALSLVFDPEDVIVWVACADSVSAIRQCSGLDRIYHNLESPPKGGEGVAALVSAGLSFVESFSDSMSQLSQAALRAEIYEDSAKPDDERIQQFFDKAGFWRQITEEDCAQVVETLGQNFRMLTPRLYDDLFDLITSDGETNSQELREPFTALGRKVIVHTVQDTIELHWQILFSQLILLVHMEFEIEDEEAALHSRFDVGSVYRRLIDALRRLEQLRWMAKTELSIPVSKADRSSSGTASPTAKRGNEETYSITALEGLTGHLFGLSESNNMPMLSSITDLVLDLCSPGSSTELSIWLLQCWLLKHGRPDLALELNPFAEQDPFSTYVQGRVFLAVNQFDTASVYFRKASVGLSVSMKNVERHSASLLDDTEWNLLNSGLPNYYAHIVNLYDRQKAYSYVVEFARLALQFIHGHIDDAAGARSEMLSRLFTAATAISHFDVAHSALLSMDDEAMQKSYLRKMVEKMCETGDNAELISLPFSGLQNKVDDILLEKCRATKDVLNGVPYHHVLYAWRISHNDYRGGAAILLDRLQKLRLMGEGDKVAAPSASSAAEDALDTHVTRQYLLLINALSCVPAKEAYILEEHETGRTAAAETHALKGGRDDLEDHLDELAQNLQQASAAAPPTGRSEETEDDEALVQRMKRFADLHGATAPLSSRKLLTLADLRKQYQQELDRIVAIQNNQFGFSAEEDDFMDVGA